jgi:putative lipase involved disintegration of autophagic bodies
MFSCCCGAISGNWRPVCSCGRGTNLCKQSCLEEHAVSETTYYQGAMVRTFLLQTQQTSN